MLYQHRRFHQWYLLRLLQLRLRHHRLQNRNLVRPLFLNRHCFLVMERQMVYFQNLRVDPRHLLTRHLQNHRLRQLPLPHYLIQHHRHHQQNLIRAIEMGTQNPQQLMNRYQNLLSH